MKTLSLIITVFLLTALNLKSSAQSAAVAPQNNTPVVSPAKPSPAEIKRQESLTKKWEEDQIAKGAPYVILENGEKAFYAAPPTTNDEVDGNKNEDQNKTEAKPE